MACVYLVYNDRLKTCLGKQTSVDDGVEDTERPEGSHVLLSALY